MQWICFSLSGMNKFQHVCGVSEYSDDLLLELSYVMLTLPCICVMWYIVTDLVLGYNVTHINNMYNQVGDLKELSPEALLKLVSP